jgi:endo-1,4-beta-xylanase
MDSPITRRQALGLAGAGLAGVTLPAGAQPAPARLPTPPATVDSGAGGEEWRGLDRPLDRYDPTSGVEAEALAAAREGIRIHRMEDAVVRCLDRQGRPLRGARFAIEQVAHAFPFGEQLWSLDAMARDGEWESERARAWRQRFTELFNAATNLCYWTERPRHDASKTEDRQGEPRVENFATTVAWTRGAGLLAKGHPLTWSIPKCVPEWVQRYPHSTQLKFLEVRVRSLVARFRGQIAIWDAVNEPMWEAALRNLPQRQWPHIESLDILTEDIARILGWCREEDPDALFLLNDYGMETDPVKPLTGTDGQPVTAARQRQRYLDLVRALQDRGAGPDAIGLQAHTGLISHSHQRRIYDQFATAGIPVHITEFWARIRDFAEAERMSPESREELLAEYVANYLTCAFGHSAVDAFFFWGLMGSAIQWHERSAHDLKPVYHRIRDLLHTTWRTRLTAVTDDAGEIRFRGFRGGYRCRPLVDGTPPAGQAFTLERTRTGPVLLRW